MEAVYLLIQGTLVGWEKRNILVETDSNDIKNIKTSACKERPVYDPDTFKQIRTMKVYISEWLLPNQFEGTEYIEVDNRNTTIIIESPNCKK